MPRVRKEHLAARRQQILRGAAVCFARKGFHQTTMEDICRQTELSMGAVYRYFSGKDQIIAAMAEAGRERHHELLEAMRGGAGTLQSLERLAHAFFSMLEYDAEVWALDPELWAEALRNPAIRRVVGATTRGVRAAIAETVREAQEQGEVNPELDPEAVARVIVSFFEGLVLQKALDPRLDVWQYVTVVRAMLTGLFWQGAARGGQSPPA
ncbi:MAG: TetR/AcrR family transcriptional regulator [Dehalococcoidia bacterium]